VSATELDSLHAVMCCVEILCTGTGCTDCICTLRAVVCGCAPRSVTSNNNNIIYLFTAIGLSPGRSGYFTCKQNMKLVTARFKSGGLHEKHIVATWNVGNRLSVCL